MGLTEFLLVVAVVGGIIAVLYPTFRSAAGEAKLEEPRSVGATAADGEATRKRRELEERRLGVIDSLEEIEADRDAGNLSQQDYERQQQRYEREAASVLRELAALEPTKPAAARQKTTAPPSARSPLPAALGWVLAGVAFGVLAMVMVTGSVSPRGPGAVMTGSLPNLDLAQAGAGERGGGGGGGGGGGALVPVDRVQLAALERAVAEDSSDVEALVELGSIYLATQQFDRVARVSMRALSMDSTNAGALTNLGMVLAASGHPTDALQAFDRALDSDDDYDRALLFKGIIAFQGRDFQTAIDSWEHYLRVAPPEANTERVVAMLQAARMAAAGQTAP